MIGVKRQHPGFTLIELVIVAAVFAVIFLVATTVYTNAFRNHRTIQSKQESTSDVRYLMETLARAIRTSTINYDFADYTTGISNPLANARLSLLAEDGSTPCYYLDQATKKLMYGSTGCTGGTDITPAQITINNLVFSIFPTADPYSYERGVCAGGANQGQMCTIASQDADCGSGQLCQPPNIQPHVTFFIESQVTLRGSTTTSFQQTTVTSRVYRR